MTYEVCTVPTQRFHPIYIYIFCDPENKTYISILFSFELDEQELNELEDSIGDVGRGLSEGRISRLPTHKYGTKTKNRWWQIKKKKFVATDTQ